MTGKKRSASSGHWLQGHFSDEYVQQAQKKGLRSCAWLKLDGVQQNNKVLKPGMTIADLGAAPDGWSQHAVVQIGNNERIIARDLLPMDPIVGADSPQGDFRDELVLKTLLRRVGDSKVQIVVSDVVPDMYRVPMVDIPRTMYLVKLTPRMSRDILAPGGSFVVRTFQGRDSNEYPREIRSLLTKVKVHKPDSSRACSCEVYTAATGRKP